MRKSTRRATHFEPKRRKVLRTPFKPGQAHTALADAVKAVTAKPLSAGKKSAHKIAISLSWFKRRKVINIGVSALVIVGLLVGILLPMTTVQASETLNWSTNADFAMNKTSKCGTTINTNIVLSSAAYTDATCAASDTDANLRLADELFQMNNVASYAAGVQFSAAVKKDGTVWTWGRNLNGVLGDNTTATFRNYPTQVKGPAGVGFLTNAKSVAVNETQIVVVKNDGTVWTWGLNGYGQLGIGTTVASTTPIQVKGLAGAGFLTDVKSVALPNTIASSVTAVKNDGTVWAWGYNGSAQLGDGSSVSRTTPVQVKLLNSATFLTNVVDIDVGISHTLALKSDGTVWSWGQNGYGQLGNGTNTARTGAVQAKDADGVAFLSNVLSIAAADNQSFAVKSDGTAFGWGSNGYGQLGNGASGIFNNTLPLQMIDLDEEGYLTGVAKINAGISSTFIVKTDGSLISVGLNNYGQLGNGTTNSASTPLAAKSPSGSALRGIKSINAGNTYTLGLTDDDTLFGWGLNNYYQLGVRFTGVSELYPNPVIEKVYTRALTDVASAATGDFFTIAAKNDGTVWSWGYNGYGQLGNGNVTASPVPVQVQNSDGSGFLSDVTQVATGDNFSLALKSDGTVWSWGRNNYGQLGNGVYDDSAASRPQQVRGVDGTGYLTDIKSVTTGGSTGFAIKNDGTALGWGYSRYGNVGTGSVAYENVYPALIKNTGGSAALTDVKAIAAGDNHTLAVKNDGTVWSWGYNNEGQLGVNTLAANYLPVQVKSPDGAAYLTGFSAVAAGWEHSVALKSDGTVWSWGSNVSGQLGINTTVRQLLPVQVKDSAGTGLLGGITSINSRDAQIFALKSDTTLVAWGYGAQNQLGDNVGNSSNPLPRPVVGYDAAGTLSNVKSMSAGLYHGVAVGNDGAVSIWGYSSPNVGIIGYDNMGSMDNPSRYARPMLADYKQKAGYSKVGTSSGFVVDAGIGKKRQWNTVDWTSASLPANTKIAFSVRTSNDGTTWSAWTPEATQATVGTTTGTADITTVPLSRFIELQSRLLAPDQSASPTLNDFSITYVDDAVAPTSNASALEMRKTSAGATITAASWTNAASPYFSWTAGTDNAGGMGLLGYCAYLGHDASANVQQTKGLLGTSPTALNGAGCQYITTSANIDIAANALSTQMSTAAEPYYLLIKAIDKAGNVFAGPAASYSFKFDNTPPVTPAFISAPSQFIATKEATLTWPTAGSTAASDADSGLAGLQYKVGVNGTWYGDGHTGAQDITDVLANDGTYTTDPTRDYPLLNEGNNIVYFRTIDNAGNVSTTNNTAAIKINTTSPTPPQNLTATPATNTTNAFAFSWSAPSSFVGPANALTYCYTVNTLPTANTCTFTPAGQASLATDAYATQPGENILYVVAKDEAGNVNYDTYATTTFSANTPAPGIPVGTEIADISTKATQNWKLALSWAAPTTVGAGVSKYAVYRSMNGVTFAQIATTSGLSYVDSDLEQELYYYKIRACDSANNCGAFSDVFSRTPTGRFTSPPELVTSPSVQVSTKKASFSYVTDRKSDSRIQYGTKSGEYFPGEVAVSASTKNHKVEISNLDAGTTYFYKAKWTDEDGNTGSSTELSFTTLPAPSIKNVSIVKTTLTSATIQFTAVDASQVNIAYGKTDGFGGLEAINTSRSESTYTIELNGLDDGSTYFYKFSTFDSDENEYDSRRADSFTTPPRPRISDLRFQPVVGEATSTQKVTWKTNVPANSTVSYGKVGESTRDVYDARTTTDHEMLVNNLDDASEYALLAQSRDTSGNLATSDRQSFKTALDTRAPRVSDVQVESLVKGNGSEARGQIVVSWKTDEPATSQVGYAQGSTGKNYTSQTSEDTRLSTEHVVIISDLSVSSVYHLQPISRDKSANTSSGDDKSAIIGRATDSVLSIILSTLNKIFGL